MSYRFRDNSKAAKKYRLRQMAANSAISGREMREADILQQEAWIDEGLSQDEVAQRLIAIARASGDMPS